MPQEERLMQPERRLKSEASSSVAAPQRQFSQENSDLLPTHDTHASAFEPPEKVPRNSFSAFDSQAGITLSPMSAGVPSMLTGAPIQAKKPVPEESVSFTNSEKKVLPNDYKSFNKQYSGYLEHNSQREGLPEYLENEVSAPENGNAFLSMLQSPTGKTKINGLVGSRLAVNLMGPEGGESSKEQIGEMYKNLMAGGRYTDLRQQKASSERMKNNRFTPELQKEFDSYTPEKIEELEGRFGEGFLQLKSLILGNLRMLRGKYGTFGSQMHPEDFIARIGPEFYSDFALVQDAQQVLQDGGEYFDFENNPDDKEYKLLHDYYFDVFTTMTQYMTMDQDIETDNFVPNKFNLDLFKDVTMNKTMYQNESLIGGPGFTAKEQEGYEGRVRKRLGKKSLKDRLFGRFLKK